MRRSMMKTTGGGVTFATWNPLDLNDITLSNGDLTASLSISGEGGAARSTIGKSSGKWFFEINIDTLADGNNALLSGIGTPLASIVSDNPFPGSDNFGYGVYNLSGQKYHNGTGQNYTSGFGAGTVFGVALDMDNNQIGFYLNGVYKGIAFTNLTGEFFAMTGAKLNFTSNVPYVTANFGASAFVHAVPVGFNAGLFLE